MPRIYRQNCKQCGKYYERPGAKYFCCLNCSNINQDRKHKIGKGNTGKVRSIQFRLKVGMFHKGKKWSLGRKLSEEHKKKIGNAHKGIPCSKEMKNKLSETRKRLFKEGKLNFINPFWGKKHSDSVIKKIIETKKKNYLKENHWNWKGGISDNPYPTEFNRKLKKIIRKRDNFTCQLCGRTEEEELKELNQVLSVNHIDFNKENLSLDNLNTLCVRCNVKINYKRDKYLSYFKERINYV